MSGPAWDTGGGSGGGSGGQSNDGGSSTGPDQSGSEYDPDNDPRQDPDNWTNPDTGEIDLPGQQDPNRVDTPVQEGSEEIVSDTSNETFTYQGVTVTILDTLGSDSMRVQIPGYGKSWVSGKSSAKTIIRTQPDLGNSAQYQPGNDPRQDADNWDGDNTPGSEGDTDSEWGDSDVDPPAPQDTDWQPGSGGGSPTNASEAASVYGPKVSNWLEEHSGKIGALAGIATLGGIGLSVANRGD